MEPNMGMNIKNDEAQKLAQRLVALTGESLTAAVTEALRERVERLERKGMADRLMAIGHDYAKRAALLPGKPMEIEDLYDEETGLPK
jgi:antitoxin VapB